MSRTQRTWWSVFVVEGNFKRRQITRLLMLSGVYVAVSTGVFAIFYNTTIAPIANSQLPLGGDAAPGVAALAIAWALLMAGVSALFAVVTGLYVSHLVAGPVHCFKTELRRIEEGKPPRHVHVRRGYELHEFADTLNRALESLWTRANDPEALALSELRAAIEALDLPAEDRTRLTDLLDGQKAS